MPPSRCRGLPRLETHTFRLRCCLIFECCPNAFAVSAWSARQFDHGQIVTVNGIAAFPMTLQKSVRMAGLATS